MPKIWISCEIVICGLSLSNHRWLLHFQSAIILIVLDEVHSSQSYSIIKVIPHKCMPYHAYKFCNKRQNVIGCKEPTVLVLCIYEHSRFINMENYGSFLIATSKLLTIQKFCPNKIIRCQPYSISKISAALWTMWNLFCSTIIINGKFARDIYMRSWSF